MNLAPIGIVTYSRIDHLKQTIESLKNNELAKESELYIFLDAPRVGDEEKVSIVRDYIYTVVGFKKVHIIERETNDLVQNAVLGMKQLFDEHGKCIFMEDDIVTAPGFLNFINQGLEYYKDDENFFSIGGFSIANHEDEKDFYFSQRPAFWGFGFWENRFDKLFERIPDFDEIKKDKITYKKLKEMGDDVIPMIKVESEKYFAGDVRACYHCAKNDYYNILPTKTLVKNIGLDGSGVNCGDIDVFKHLEISDKINFNFDVKYNKEKNRIYTDLNYKHFKKRIFVVRVINKLSRITIGKNIIK